MILTATLVVQDSQQALQILRYLWHVKREEELSGKEPYNKSRAPNICKNWPARLRRRCDHATSVKLSVVQAFIAIKGTSPAIETEPTI